MKLAYVSGPYSSPSDWGRQKNIQAMADVAHDLWAMGIAVINPNGNTAHFGGPDIPYETFLEGDKIMVERSDLIVMLPGWEMSKGAGIEFRHADTHAIPIYYWPEDLDLLMGLNIPGKCVLP